MKPADGPKYSEEDVAAVRKRAEVLSLLARPDNVTPAQLQLLQSATHSERQRAACASPVVDAYRRFLDDTAAAHAAELAQARARTAAARAEHAKLQARVEALQDAEARASAAAALQRDLATVRAQTTDTQRAVEAARARQRAFEEGSAKLERELALDIARLVDDDQRVALLRAEREALEKEYLLTEQRIFSLQRDLVTVGQNNAELLKVCEALMARLEAGSQ